MDKMLYVAMSGAKQLMLAQSVNSQNLANVSTTGFRADLASFISRDIKGPGFNATAMPEMNDSGVDFHQGPVMTTGNDLDVAIQGEGFIAVQGKNGTEEYTRAGDFQVTSTGQLLTGAGEPVLGNGGPIALPPYSKMEIGSDGTISIVPLGQDINSLAAVDRIKLVKPDIRNMQKSEDGLLVMKDGSIAEPDATVTVVPGSLEGSNVNAIEAMTQMIDLSRQYEFQIKLMKEAEDNDTSSGKLLSMS